MLNAVAHPERIASLFLLAPVGLGDGISGEFTDAFQYRQDSDKLLSLLQTLVHRPQMISRQIVPVLQQYLEREGVRSNLEIIARSLATANLQMQSCIAELADSAMLANDLVSVVWGEQDKIIPRRSVAVQQLPARWHILGECGHMPHIEHRSRVSSLLLDSLSRQGRQGIT